MSNEEAVLITVTRSAGDDRAVLVFIDTQFEPTGDPGLRILVNDDETFAGKAYDMLPRRGEGYDAKAVHLSVSLDDIAYTGESWS